MYSHPHAACKLVTTLIKNGFALNPEFFAPKYGSFTSKVPVKEMPGVLIERTEFYARLTDFMDLDTDKWLISLREDPVEYDWHYIVFALGAGPIVEETVMVARSVSEALAYIIEKLVEVRSKPVELTKGDSGELFIYSTDGLVATIRKVNFESVTDEYLSRATIALESLERYTSYPSLAKQLSKLPGFPKAENVPLPKEDDRARPMLDHTCKNMMIATDRALTPVVDKKIPNHLLLELTATICGFESWNHFTGAAKKHEEFLFIPYAITHDIEWTVQVEKGIHFYKGLAAGLVGFGKMLLSKPKNTLFEEPNVSGGIRLAYRKRPTDSESSLQDGAEREGLVLNKASQVYCEEESMDLAAMVLSAESPSDLLKEYFFVGLTPKERLIEFNKRIGVKPEDHIAIGDWIYWVKRGNGTQNGFFKAEKISEIEQYNGVTIGSSLHKATLVEDDDGVFWLAKDWGRKPAYKLPELTREHADLIERKFFPRENWRNSWS